MSERRIPTWASFKPSRLEQARQLVVERHPSTGDLRRAAASAELQDLKERIEAHQGDESALEKLSGQLRLSQLRGLALQIGRWEALRDAVAVVLRSRPHRSVFPHLWNTWQRYPRVDVIRELLGEMGEIHGWSEVAVGYERAVAEWTSSAEPGVGIQEWLNDQGLSYSDMEELADLPLDMEVQLARSAREAVMTDGSSVQLKTEGPRRLVGWFAELASDKRKRFGVNYLSSLEVHRWDRPILEVLRESYGSPLEGRQAFWGLVPTHLRDAFHRWFIERNLEEALGSDTERHEYWRGWSDELLNVELGKAGRVEYAVLYFKTFAVIEFFKFGNAAYFYPLEKLKEVRRGGATDPGDLKDPGSGFGGTGDNRIIHSGRWQRKADRQVAAWKRGTG